MIRSAYWAALRLGRRLRHPQIGRSARISPGARIRGGARSISIGASSFLDAGCVLDTRNGGRVSIGEGAQIHSYACLLSYGGDVVLGRNCSVNPFTVLYGHGGLRIGDNVRIATHVVIVPAEHRFERADVPIADQGISAEGIVIEDDVWLGAGVRVLDGCHIGRGSVIGAGAVVTGDIEPYSIAVGVPARCVARRGEK